MTRWRRGTASGAGGGEGSGGGARAWGACPGLPRAAAGLRREREARATHGSGGFVGGAVGHVRAAGEKCPVREVGEG